MRKNPKNPKEKKHPRIRRRVFAYLAAFVAFVLALLWLMQIVWLDDFYRWDKTRQITQAADAVESNIGNAQLSALMDRLAQQNDVCILLLDSDKHVFLSSDDIHYCLIHRMSSRDLSFWCSMIPENGDTLTELFNIAPFGGDQYNSHQFRGNVPKMEDDKKQSLLCARRVTLPDGTGGYLLLNSIITPLDSTVATLRTQLMLITIIVLLGATLLAVLISRKVTRSIVETSEAAHSLSRGQYEIPPHGCEYREMAELNDTLVYAAKELSQVENLQHELIANISHDLRTPLTLIISPLQTLLREELPDGITRRLQIMEKNARLLQEQINTLLDFRRLDVGAERLQLQPGDIAVFVRDECGQFSSYAADRCISFSFESDVESLPAKFDSDKIHKIIYNLLSNAFKYTPDGKSVAVSLRRTEGGVELNVADSGPGVADGDKQLIFERFYQSAAHASVSGSQHLTGSGIGLHIVSEYVRLMGGTIGVSDGPEGGAVFTCYIPVAETAVQGAAELVYDGACGASGAFTVLVVDDNQDMCEFIGTSLSDRYRVLTASDGEAALGVLRRETVSLVVSDVMMPVMDGLELCRRIKSDLQLSHIPVILLTAKTAEGSVMEGYEAGADDYLVKPFNVDMLKLRINKFIELAKMSHRRFRQKVDVAPDEITSTPLDEQFLKRAIEIVERHISDSDFSVEALGQELAMNRVALWKKLQAITGKGPADFIRSIRVKRGLRLLDAGEMNVSEIAYAVGYNTVKRFTENFKAEFGMTPSEYKKRNGRR